MQFTNFFWKDNSIAHLNREWAAQLRARGLAVHVPKPWEVDPEFEFLCHDYPQHQPLGRHVSFSFLPSDWSESPQATRVLLDMADTWRAGASLPLPIYHEAAATVVLSEHCARTLERRGVRNCYVVPPGVNRSVYHPHVEPLPFDYLFQPDTYFRQYGDSRRCHTWFLLAGFLQEKKGVAAFLKSWRLFHREHPECGLIIKHTPKLWANNDLIRAQVEAEAGDSCVSYTERELTQGDFARLLAAADILVQPSHLEGFGLIPLQAMAMDKPVVVTSGHGFDSYAHAHNASIIPTRPQPNPCASDFPWFTYTPDAGAYALEDALRHRYCPRRYAARRRTVAFHSWERSADALLTALDPDGYGLRPFLPMQEKALVSLVVPLRLGPRGQTDIDRLLSSLREHENWPYEVIICLDGEGELDLPPQENVRVLRLHKHQGGAAARNGALMHARGEYVMLLDADIEWIEPTLAGLVARCGREPRLVIHPRLMFPSRDIQSAGGALWRLDYPMYRTCHLGYHASSSDPRYQREVDVQYAPSAALFCRRQLIEQGGLFCEGYAWVNFEDTDFCYNAWRTGGSVRFCPQFTLIHHHGSFTGTEVGASSEYYRVNEEIFRRRYPQAPQLLGWG